MGMKAYRAVTIRPCGAVPDEPGQIVMPGLILTVYAFTEEAERAMPLPEEFARAAALLSDQIAGFESLYPALAAAEVRRALMECRDSSNLEGALGKAMERILGARAVLLYAHPYRAHRELHLIATTAPLDAPLPREVAPPREQSFRECGHRIGDDSFTGRLAANPGWSLRWTSFLLAASRLRAQGWPDKPSDLNRVLVPRTASRYGRTIAYSISDRDPERPLGVAWAHRDTDQPPFTAWDELALKAMAGTAAEVFHSWRDWHRVARARDMVTDPVREWLFLPPPRPDVFSLRSFVQEAAAVTHELVKSARLQVLQVAVLVRAIRAGRRTSESSHGRLVFRDPPGGTSGPAVRVDPRTGPRLDRRAGPRGVLDLQRRGRGGRFPRACWGSDTLDGVGGQTPRAGGDRGRSIRG